MAVRSLFLFETHTNPNMYRCYLLQNMAFQADQKVKSEIISKLGTDQLFCLLRDSIIDIVMKTLGLLRNLLAHKPHIDHIMLQSGEQVL